MSVRTVRSKVIGGYDIGPPWLNLGMGGMLARLFDDGANQYLYHNGAPVTGPPFTMAYWFWTDDLTVDQWSLSLADFDVPNQRFSLLFGSTNDTVAAVAYDGDWGVAESTLVLSVDTWYHAAGLFVSNTERHAFTQGRYKGTDVTDIAPTGIDYTYIGYNGAPGSYTSGPIFLPAIWDVILSDAEIQALGSGKYPWEVRPQNLVGLWFVPGQRNDRDYSGNNYHMTAVNTPTWAPGPTQKLPQIIRRRQQVFVSAVGAQTIQPSAIASLEAFGTAQLNLTVLPSAITSLEAFGTPNLAFDQYIENVGNIATAEAFGTPSVNLITLPSAIASLEAFGTPQLNLIILPSSVTSAEAFGATTVISDVTVIPDAIASLEAFGATTVIREGIIEPTGIVSAETFGTPQLNLTILPISIISTEAFGTAVLGMIIQPGAIASGEAFGTPQLNLIILPSSIASLEGFGITTIFNVDQYIICSGILSAEAFGATTVTGGEPSRVVALIALEDPRVRRHIRWQQLRR